MSTNTPTKPPNKFDRLATAVANQVSRAWFFALCVLLVVIWAPSYFALSSVDTWQLIINTATTIITFLLVALLQNTQYRADAAVQTKLNALVEAIADLMETLAEQDPTLPSDVEKLRRASGLERREGT